jgi:hypothetical protein
MRKAAPAVLFVALLACSAVADYTIDEAVYSRLVLFDNHVVYAEAVGDTMRFAPTPEGLKDAPPVTGTPWENGILFKDVAIPLPAEAVPEGFTVTGQFFFAPARIRDEAGNDHVIPWTHGKIWVSRTDDQDVRWTCVFRAGAGVDKNMVPDLGNAPEVQADLSQGLNLDLTAFPLNAIVRAGLRLMSGDVQLENILRDGKPTMVGIAILGPDGQEVASKTGTLRDFALSSMGIPRYSAPVARPGEYTCKVVMPAGPLGKLEAETKMTVSDSALAAFTLDKAVYGKLILFKDCVLYAKAEGDTMRFATGPEGLNDAPIIKGRSDRNGIWFNDVSIPIPAEGVPQGFSGASGRFYFYTKRVVKDADGSYQFIPGTVATLWLSSLDDRNIRWDYVFQPKMDMLGELDQAPEAHGDLSEGINLDIALTSADSDVYVGLHLASGNLPMENIMRNGSPAPVEVALFGPDGEQVASKTGTLADFGFT